MKKLLLTLLLPTILASTLSAQSQRPLTKDDTLRGTITKERSWWDLTYYHLSVKVNPGEKSLAGQVVVNYQVISSYQKMQIDLQPPLKMGKVTQDGQELTFEKIGNNAHFIQLKKDQKPGSLESIIIEYSGIPVVARNPPWQGGVTWAADSLGNSFIATSCQGLGASVWWPCKDHMYDEPDSMLISITVPPKLTDVSNGRLRKISYHADGSRTFDWFVDNPINNYGVNINAGDYVHWSDTLHGENGILDLDFYVLRYNLEKAQRQFTQAKKMLKAFEYWFGPYPFYKDGYKLVETPYLGMEHQSSITYGNKYKNGYLGRDLSGTGWGLKWDFIIVHESGHEWFANNISYRDMADMWVHEGFTNYSESLFTEYYFGKDAANEYVVGTRKGIRNDRPIIGIYNVNRSGSGDMYPKGGNMLQTIRHCIDDDKLWRDILRGLNKTFYHQTVTSQQVENFISTQAHRDFSKVFDQFLRTIQIPTFEYYREGNKFFYRWTNCMKGFDLSLVLRNDSGEIRIFPLEEWKSTKLKKDQLSLVDGALVEKMYYVKPVLFVKSGMKK